MFSEILKRRRVVVHEIDFDKIPLMGFGTFGVENPMVIYNALSVGYRHLDLAESSKNLQHVKHALSLAFAPLSVGGLGIERKDVWITMKIQVQSINNINALLTEVGTDYFDLLLYHNPFEMFGSKDQLTQLWRQMTEQPKAAVRRVGVSNFYALHLTRLFNICREFMLEKPFANEIQINPYVFFHEKDTIDLCSFHDIQVIAYSPLGFNFSHIILGDRTIQSIAGKIGITAAQLALAWLLSKRICVIPKSNSIQRQVENFASKDAIYSASHFSDEMDTISVDKGPNDFLIQTAELAKNQSQRLSLNVPRPDGPYAHLYWS
jgi:diketogulonate reductase-like aldo/keto reductase